MYAYSWVYVYVCVYIYTRGCLNWCSRLYMYVYTYIYVYMYIFICMHLYTYRRCGGTANVGGLEDGVTACCNVLQCVAVCCSERKLSFCRLSGL